MGGRTWTSLAKLQTRVRDEVRRPNAGRPQDSLADVVAELQQYIAGARNYFRGVRRRTLAKLDYFVARETRPVVGAQACA